MEKIEKVTVYLDRALITRTQNVSLENENPVSFMNIPQSLFLNSLRAKGNGTADFKIRSINQRYDYYNESPDEKIKNLQAELCQLESKITLLKEKSKKLEEFYVLISQLRLKNINQIPVDFQYQKSSLEEIEKLYQFLQNQNLLLDEQIFKIKKETRELERKRKAFAKNLEQLEAGKSKTLLNIDLALEVTKKGEASFDLSYLVPNALWRPYYEARLYLDKSELEMVYLAEVSQKTGEDWKDVEITLSTAKPSQGAFLPELSTWWIDFYYPPKTSPKLKSKKMSMDQMPCCESNVAGAPIMMKMESVKESEEKAVEELMDEEIESTETYSEVNSEGLNVSFIIPKNDSIGCDGTSKKVTVDKKRFPVKIEYIVIPKIAQSAFIQVSFENQSGYPYLAGDALIFHASDYVGKSNFETAVSGEEVELFMGADENVKVERLLINQVLSKKLFGGNKKMNFQYKTTITNFRENEVKLSVYDNLPIAENEKIKIKIENISLNYTEIDKKNIMRWDLALKPKEKQEIMIEISVEYPKEMSIYGI